MIKIKTHDTIIESDIQCIGWKNSFVWLLSQSSKFDIFWQYETYDFAHNVTNILDIPAIFIFCIVLDAMNKMQMLFDARTVSSYLPRYQALTIYVREVRQRLV